MQIWSPGYGHTRGDTIAWVEAEKVLFSGDLVEYEAGVYTGDAQLAEWPATLEALRALGAEAIVPGRGEAMKGNADVNKALDYTKRWVTTLFQAGKEAAAAGMDLKAAMAHTRKSMDPVFGHVFIYEHCLPFDVSRALTKPAASRTPASGPPSATWKCGRRCRPERRAHAAFPGRLAAASGPQNPLRRFFSWFLDVFLASPQRQNGH